jgi:hypothetical protein
MCMSACVQEKAGLTGKFVVPKASEPGLGRYFALVLGPARKGSDKLSLFVWNASQVVQRSVVDVENNFEVFDDEQSAKGHLLSAR